MGNLNETIGHSSAAIVTAEEAGALIVSWWTALHRIVVAERVTSLAKDPAFLLLKEAIFSPHIDANTSPSQNIMH